MYSMGIILFTMVKGTFPFHEASHYDFYYNMIIDKRYKAFWEEHEGDELSDEFKDLFVKMVSYDPNNRPTAEQLRNHPWMLKEFNIETANQNI